MRGWPGSRAPIALRQAGHNVELREASDRAGGRCWTIRGAFADGQIAERGGEFIDTGHDRDARARARARLPAGRPARAEQRGTELLGFFDGHAVPRTRRWQPTSRWPGPRSSAMSPTLTIRRPTTSRRREGESSTAMSIIDYLDEAIPGGSSSRLGQLLDVAYTIEYGADSAQQSSLNLLYLLGYSGHGQFRIFGASDEQLPRRRRQRPDCCRDSRPSSGNRITYESELVSVTKRSGGSFSLGFRQRHGGTRDRHRGQGRARAPLLDHPPVGRRLEARVSRAAQAHRDRRAGDGHELEAPRPVLDRRLWRRLGSNGETFADTGYQNTWEVTRAQAGHEPGSSSTTRAARSVRASAPGRRLRRAKQFLAQLEPRPPRDHEAVERACDDRLLARLPVDERLVLVLEGRAVHALRAASRASGRATASSRVSTRRSTFRGT